MITSADMAFLYSAENEPSLDQLIEGQIDISNRLVLYSTVIRTLFLVHNYNSVCHPVFKQLMHQDNVINNQQHHYDRH